MNIQVLISFFGYFLLLLAVGIFSRRKLKNSADFIMGNRSLNFWLTALTAHASDMSAWLFMAFPAALYSKGLSQIWIAIGLIVGMFLNWQFVAKRLRIETEKYQCYTLSSYFEKRFQDDSGILRVLTATMSVIFLTAYLSSGLIGMELLFSSLFGIDYYVGLSIATGVVVTYTLIGGFNTIAWTDFVQGTFLMVVIVLVAIMSYFTIPGWAAVQDTAALKQISLALVPDSSFESIFAIIFLIMSWGLGYFGQPHIITKFMGIKDPAELNKSKYLGMSWQIVSLGAAAAIGLIGITFFKEGLQNPELVFVEMVKELYSPLIGGFILCAFIAANMSTMDSQILVCASNLSEDFYKHLFKQNASPEHLLKISRFAVVLVSLVALGIAFARSTTILSMVLYAWSGLGSAFGPLVLSALYFPKSNRYGAIAGILVGGSLAGFWPALNGYFTSYPVPSMIPGFLGGFFAIYLVSKLTATSTQLSHDFVE